MIDFEKHVKRLHDALGVRNAAGKNCIDKIDEGLWWNVMYELNQASIECANDLQGETRSRYPKDMVSEGSVNNITGTKSIEESRKQKDGNVIIEKLEKSTGFQLSPIDLVLTDSIGNILGVRRLLKYSDAPPMRLLSMTLLLSYWLGFLDASEHHELHKGATGAWDRIDKAYHDGFATHPKSKSKSNPNAKTEGISS